MCRSAAVDARALKNVNVRIGRVDVSRGGARAEDGSGHGSVSVSGDRSNMDSMNSPCYTVAMDLGVCQLRNFSISFLSSLLSAESSHVKLDNR